MAGLEVDGCAGVEVDAGAGAEAGAGAGDEALPPIGAENGELAPEPNDAQTQVQLAAAYLSAGRRTDAVAALQKAEALNPDFKQQGDYYIQQIEAGKNP